MKKLLLGLVLSLILSQLVCAAPLALLITNVNEPVAVTALNGYDKVGESYSVGVLALVAFGDAGIDAACRNGNIKEIHHVDKSIFSFLAGLWMVERTIVYGK
jgi:hypothetical protein